ncbi:DUF2063 domain-containing protein [Halothiobacillus sp. DCM-1]|uniref:HvfC family RiPP maturation protein n=1 Tax=Halothiobacillus sp. DCM-1 TaxID=3112558 RepID=UPI00324887EB
MTTDFRALQAAFTAFIRNPDSAPVPPGCDPDRMRLYHTLFFNNFDGVLESTFARFKASLDDTDWYALVRPFFAEVPQHSPFFSDVPLRFAEYLAEHSPIPLTRAQQELIAYEAALHECRIGSEQVPPDPGAPPADLLTSRLRPHPDGLLLECGYPVHQAAFDPIQGAAATTTWLWLQRDADGVVQTTELSAASARWLVLLDAHPEQSAAANLEQLATELGQSPDALRPLAEAQLQQWWASGLLIATTTSPEEK